MSALAKRMESAADQWRRSRPYYWSQTARDASREKSVKSWDEYRAMIDSAEAGGVAVVVNEDRGIRHKCGGEVAK